MSRRKITWSNLPSELLSPIANRLETRLDILHFRAVCKGWRRSLSLSRLPGKNILSLILPHKISITNPCLLKGISFFSDRKKCRSLILVPSSIFLIKPIEIKDNHEILPWLITVDEVKAGKLSLRKPFSRYGVKNMPEDFKISGLDKFDIQEMGRVYSLRFDEGRYNFYDESRNSNNLFEEDHKVVLMGETRSKIDDCSAVLLYDYGKLVVINLEDDSVEEVSFKGRRFDDIVVFNGMVYVTDRYGRLYLMDKSGKRFKLSNIIKDSLKPGNERKSRLVESCGELYLVRKCLVSKPGLQKRCPGFRVYKLNEEKNSWDELNSIGDDRILFVTPDCCFFGRTSDFFGWKGNSIMIHSEDSFVSYTRFPTESDDEYYEYYECIEAFHFEDCKFTTIDYNRCYSAVFWPPPKWICPDDYFPELYADQRGYWW